MDTSIVGIYKSSSNAQSAMNELLKSGFSQNDIQLSGSGQTGGGVAHSLKEETGVSEFFRNLSGREDTRSHAEMYEHAAAQGNIVLTVHAPSEEMAHRAADVMDRFDPVDVEEYGASMGSQRMSSSTGSKPSASMTGAPTSSTPTGMTASPEGKDDVQKGRRQPVEAAEEEGPSASAEPAGMGQAGSGMGTAKSGTSAINTGATASAEGKDDLQKGRSQSVEAAEEEGPSAVSGVRMYQRNTGAPVQRPSAMGGQGVTGKGSDDSRFRSHWQSTYSASGSSYDEHQPAYRYGSDLRNNERWRGKQWSDMESGVRSDWEAKNPKGMWERFKDAVRYGWENPSGTYEDEARSLGSRMEPGMGAEIMPEKAQGRSSGGERARPSTSASPGTGTSTAGRPAGASMSGGMSTTGGAFKSDAERSGAMSTSGKDYDDSMFRSHWQKQYGSSGGSYDEYDPAYLYGYELRKNERWRGKQWSDIEPDVRKDWEASHPKGTWEKFKDSIRYGWESMTGSTEEKTRQASSGKSRTATESTTAMRGGGAHVPDDAEFRSHWQHNHWISGGNYDDYAPAYRYGADYADNDTNPNHQWKDVEARMRSDWQTYNAEPGSWDKNVDAIRYGWEKGKQRARGTHSGESLR